MVFYVPYFTPVDDIASSKDLEMYRRSVRLDETAGFYEEAPDCFHAATSPDGKLWILENEDDIRQFYRTLPKEEQDRIKDKGGLVAKFLD